MLPEYSNLLDKLTAVKQVATIYALGQEFTLFTGKIPNSDVGVIAIKNDALYDRKDGPYTDKNNINWPDNALCLAYFQELPAYSLKSPPLLTGNLTSSIGMIGNQG